MKNLTVNQIVRRALKLHGLSSHYYIDLYNIALMGVRTKLNQQILPNVDVVKLTIGSDNTVDIPADAIDVLSVGIETGDKVRRIGKGLNINARDTSGQPFSEPDTSEYSTTTFQTDFYQSYFSKYGDFYGKLYGVGMSWTEEYKVLRSLGKIRFNMQMEATEVNVVYLKEPEKLNNETLVHPYAEEALIDYIAWQYAKYNRSKSRFDEQIKKKDFYNSFRILRSKKWNITTADLKRVFRRNYKLSPKV